MEAAAQQDKKTSVTWTEGLEQLTMYAYDTETHEVPVNPKGVEASRGSLILSDTGVDSQDSGLGNLEPEIKETPIGEPAAFKGEPSKRANPRDPRRQAVTMASPSTLFGEGNILGLDPANISQPTPSTSWANDFLMEEADWKPPLIIDIESE